PISIFRNLTSVGIIDSNSFSQRFDTDPLGAVIVWPADFDLDGKPDIATMNSSGVTLLRNLGTGPGVDISRFGEPVVINVSAGADVNAFAVGDVDGDGKPDLVVLRGYPSPSSSISVFRNLTAGPGMTTNSFAATGEIPGPYVSNGGAIGIEDMNGDGKADLVVLYRSDAINSSFRVFLNNGSPGAISASSFAPPAI